MIVRCAYPDCEGTKGDKVREFVNVVSSEGCACFKAGHHSECPSVIVACVQGEPEKHAEDG